MNDAVRLETVSHRYKHTDVLKQVSFQVRQGTFCIVIGPNGSGKTTLLKTIAGLEKASSGQISIFGRPVETYSARELAKIAAYVPQMASTDFPFSVFDAVRMGRAPHLGWLGVESEVDTDIAKKAMIFTDIHHLADRKLNQLSGGECQRVQIARAICQAPQLMLLDEPTASLDLGHQTRIMDLMDKLKTGHGMTILMISHDINLAAMYADHILILKNGRISCQGTPDDVITYNTLEEAYHCIVLVDKSPLGGRPRVTLVPEKYQKV